MTASTGRNMAGHLVGDRYMLLSMIAKGGMGEVWKARDQRTGKIVAAKVLRPELSGESLPLNRLRLEAQNTLRIDHPNIAAVFDSGEDDGRGWLVMELVDGRPLTDYLRQGNRLAPRELIPILIQISMALDAAASAGVVHRDIKPANVLVRSNGVVKLTDFGISRTKNQVDLTQAGMVMGTAQYLPPEQALGEAATSVGDLYSVGVIAYEACAGKRPFTGKTQVDIAFSHVHDQVPRLPEDVPHELARVIYHLLEKEPHKRIQSGQELVRELVNAAQELGLAISPQPVTLPATLAGEAAAEPTHAQPALPPVHHEPVRHLPDEMLVRPNLDEARLDVLVPERPMPQRRFHPVRQYDEPRDSVSDASAPSVSEPVTSTASAAPSVRADRIHSIPSRSEYRMRQQTSPQATGTRRGKAHWHSLEAGQVFSAQTLQRPKRIRSAYSRSVVAPQAKTYQRKMGWLWGLALLFVSLIIVFALLRMFAGSNIPLPFLNSGAQFINDATSGYSAGFFVDEEALHV